MLITNKTDDVVSYYNKYDKSIYVIPHRNNIISMTGEANIVSDSTTDNSTTILLEDDYTIDIKNYIKEDSCKSEALPPIIKIIKETQLPLMNIDKNVIFVYKDLSDKTYIDYIKFIYDDNGTDKSMYVQGLASMVNTNFYLIELPPGMTIPSNTVGIYHASCSIIRENDVESYEVYDNNASIKVYLKEPVTNCFIYSNHISEGKLIIDAYGAPVSRSNCFIDTTNKTEFLCYDGDVIVTDLYNDIIEITDSMIFTQARQIIYSDIEMVDDDDYSYIEIGDNEYLTYLEILKEDISSNNARFVIVGYDIRDDFYSTIDESYAYDFYSEDDTIDAFSYSENKETYNQSSLGSNVENKIMTTNVSIDMSVNEVSYTKKSNLDKVKILYRNEVSHDS